MATQATTPKEYLDALPPERRRAMAKIRATIRKNLPKGYKEDMQYGMIGYFVPHSAYPEGYHCDPTQPLPFLSIASQKNYMALHLFCIYLDPKAKASFIKAWKASGCKLDMGAACVRFKSIDDVPLDVVGDAVAAIPMDAFIKKYETTLPASVKKKRKAARG